MNTLNKVVGDAKREALWHARHLANITTDTQVDSHERLWLGLGNSRPIEMYSHIHTLTTKIKNVNRMEQTKHYQYPTPLKQWIIDVDNLTLTTLNLHRSFTMDADRSRFLLWYNSNGDKPGEILLTNRSMHLEDSLGSEMNP